MIDCSHEQLREEAASSELHRWIGPAGEQNTVFLHILAPLDITGNQPLQCVGPTARVFFARDFICCAYTVPLKPNCLELGFKENL